MYEALSYYCRGLELLVYEALSYKCRRQVDYPTTDVVTVAQRPPLFAQPLLVASLAQPLLVASVSLPALAASVPLAASASQHLHQPLDSPAYVTIREHT